MMNQLLIAIILSIMPISELRGGLPLAIDYALKNQIAIWPIFLLILILNILVIFFVFFFLDFLHESFMKFSLYRKSFNFYIRSIRKRIDKVEKRLPSLGYFALTLFVAIPAPVTGAWTGTLIAWIIGLERKESILAIALGVIIAGILILLASLGFIGILNA